MPNRFSRLRVVRPSNDAAISSDDSCRTAYGHVARKASRRLAADNRNRTSWMQSQQRYGTKRRFKEKTMKRFLISKLIVAGIGLSALGIAVADLTPDQVKARLEAAGYSNVQIVRREGSHFDAVGTKDGKRVSLDVDGKTGAISPEKEGKDEEHEHK